MRFSPLILKARGSTTRLSPDNPLEKIRSKERFVNETDVDFYNNFTYEFKRNKSNFIINLEFREFREINDSINIPIKKQISHKLYDEKDNLSSKEKLMVNRYKLVTMMGPIFQIIFLILFIIFLKKIGYPLNVIAPLMISHSLFYTRAISNEVAYFFDLLYDHTFFIIYIWISLIIITYSSFMFNKNIIYSLIRRMKRFILKK